nr:hypothetical protein [uncultured Mediterranean phage uvMED]
MNKKSLMSRKASRSPTLQAVALRRAAAEIDKFDKGEGKDLSNAEAERRRAAILKKFIGSTRGPMQQFTKGKD